MITNFSYYSIKWLEEKKHYIKYSTFCAYQTVVYNYLNNFFLDVSEITEKKLASFEASLIDKGLSYKSIKDIQIVLKMIIKKLTNAKLVNENLIYAIKTKKDRHSNIDVLNKKEYKSLLLYLTQHFSFKNLGILVTLCTGMRIGEICALRWKDINIENNEIHVHKTLQRVYDSENRTTKIIIGSPKTEQSDRYIPMSNKLKQIIKPLMKVVNSDYFVISNDIKPIEPRTYRNYFNELCKNIGMRKVKFHCLRHSFATRCVESSSDYKSLSAILGHSNIGITLNLYVHPNSEQKKKCIEKMLNNF